MELEVVPADYDKDPERFRASVRSVEQYGLLGDVHEAVSERPAQVLPPSPPATFDAENGPDMVGDFFQAIEVERGDGDLPRRRWCR